MVPDAEQSQPCVVAVQMQGWFLQGSDVALLLSSYCETVVSGQ